MNEPRVADILLKICDRRRARVAQARRETYRPPAAEARRQTADTNPFLRALSKSRGHAVIAEVKMGSPMLGSLVERVEPLAQARIYRDHGAAALSVVVEPDFFHGSYELLAACHEASGLPTIAKDFIVDPVQLHWAKRSGASAVLLIAALLSADELREYADLARRLGLVPLVETHELSDVMKLQGGVWELVGCNNRNLRTFEVELENSMALLPSLPAEALKVAESGIQSSADIGLLRSVGFDAFLVGESLLLAADPAAHLRSLTGKVEDTEGG